MAHLVGTPYFPDLRGAILFLEDVDEPFYRIDRMLTQLWLAGALAGIAGVAFGKFTEGGPSNGSRPEPGARGHSRGALPAPWRFPRSRGS